MKWISDSMTHEQKRAMHLFNFVMYPVALALLLTITHSLWVVIPASALTGAAMFNSVTWWHLAREMRRMGYDL